jgi:insertion element IS1 protein InsB
MCNTAHTYCPRCLSANIKKNGVFGKHFRQQYKCKSCGKKFSLHSNTYYINAERKTLIGSLLLERISLRGICRAIKVSLTWLMGYLREIWADLPADLCFKITTRRKSLQGHFYVCMEKCEADEVWSFVQNKGNKQYIWFVQHRETRQIIAFEVGDRSRETAQKLWAKIPPNIQENGLFYTDDWDSYKTVIPEAQHLYDKYKKHTNHIERFNNTLRQRCSRLVRENLAFSKSLNNHILAIQFFICHYNLECQKKSWKTTPIL